jgi:hypothetical protein
VTAARVSYHLVADGKKIPLARRREEMETS